MQLGELIQQRQREILGRWEQIVRGRSSAANALSQVSLMDHLPQLLERLAEIANGVERLTMMGGAEVEGLGTTHLVNVHAVQRLGEGFDLGQVVDEFGALRECILDEWWESSGPPSREELRLLDETIHRAVALSVERYTVARERTLQAFDKISAAALESRQIDVFLQRLLGVLIDTTESADTAAILLREDDSLRVRAAVGLEQEVEERFTVKVGEGFAGSIARDVRPSLIPNAAEDPLVASDVIRARGVRGMYGVPLVEDGRVIGVAHMGSRTARDFSEQDKRLFAAMASRATAAIVQHLLRDDAERRTAELEAVLRSIPDAVYIGNEQGITMANDAAAEIIGLASTGGVVRESAAPRLDFRDPKSNMPLAPDANAFARALRGERAEDEVVARHLTNGVDVFLRVSAAPVVVAGSRIGAVAIATDITRLKALEQAREDFIGMVTHDLRTPLTAIRSLAQVTSRTLERANDGANAERVRRIDAQVDKMNRLLGDLLDITRAKTGHLTVDLQPIELVSLLRESVEVWRTSSATHVVELHAPPRADVRADADRLSQVMNNLLSNAIKYSPRGGRVTARLVVHEGEVVVSVSDEGIGMSEEEQGRLFAPWSRATTCAVEKISGTGLGLFIVAELLKAHGGRVWLDSVPNKGTTVSFSLPRAS